MSSINDFFEDEKLKNYKKYCEENDEYLYRIECSKGIFYSLGEPSVDSETGLVIEFTDIKTKKDKIFKFGLNDTYSIEEL